MKFKHTLYSLSVLGTAFLALPVQAADLTAAFDQKHKSCLEKIAVDAEVAFEDALAWETDGGGRRARHCKAMAMFALGHKEEAARRLDALAKATDGGTNIMRANFYAEAANFWLMSNRPVEAYESTTAGLRLREDHIDLRIARARSYALQERYDHAETDLTSALSFDPGHAAALRYRADARWKQGKIDAALSDIEHSLLADPESVETALLRGRIKEDIRQKEGPKSASYESE